MRLGGPLAGSEPRLDYDGKPVMLAGRPVTIMERLAAQVKAKTQVKAKK